MNRNSPHETWLARATTCLVVGAVQDFLSSGTQIRLTNVPREENRLGRLWTDLMAAVTELDREFDELKLAARQRLGQLFSDVDYPSSLHGLFDVVWDYPSVEPPAYVTCWRAEAGALSKEMRGVGGWKQARVVTQ